MIGLLIVPWLVFFCWLIGGPLGAFAATLLLFPIVIACLWGMVFGWPGEHRHPAVPKRFQRDQQE